MSGARARVAQVRAVVVRPLVAGLVVGGLAAVLGMELLSAASVTLLVAAVVAVLQRVDATAEPGPPRHVAAQHDGARGEVLELAWTMVGRDGRAGERALKRLRAAGARRLARHGVDLADPAQADAARALVGARAHATLTRTQHPLPSVGDLRHALGALEDLGPTRDAPSAAPPPTTPSTDREDPR